CCRNDHRLLHHLAWRCCKEASDTKAASQPALAISATTPSKVMKKPVVVAATTGRLVSKARRSAASGRGKVGLEAHRQGVSSASLARQANPDISSRELARVVRDQRSRSGAQGSASGQATRRQRPRNAAEAMQVSGTKVGHTEKLTGDEAGLCHSGVTGTAYMAAEIFDDFCQDAPPKAAVKVETTETLTGNRVTSGGKVGGASVLTGIDAGSCRNVTGSEYLGREHFASQCDTTPEPSAAKVSHSQTQRGTVISGPKASRAEKVSGNEKGTCSAVTGTPYAGMETFESYCSTAEQRESRSRSVMPDRQAGGKDITGIQPGLANKQMTGGETGACQAVSGTPYLAASEVKEVCGAAPAVMGDADFPQPLSEVASGQFSLVPSVAGVANVVSKAVERKQPASVAPARTPISGGVTGTGYEGQDSITGTFSMGKGKVTGTEQSRFGGRANNVVAVETKPQAAAKPNSVTGEGLSTGLNITGDDWDRGDRVTGTEGGSAAKRNPTIRGPMNAMPEMASKREPLVERPSANVTGGSGGSQGSAVTVSGGARG
ncbi:CsoS2 family carboxysome shell protein, partial [Pseudomonadota bacterium]